MVTDMDTDLDAPISLSQSIGNFLGGGELYFNLYHCSIYLLHIQGVVSKKYPMFNRYISVTYCDMNVNCVLLQDS